MSEVRLTGGGFEVEAGVLASAFRLDPAGVPGLMRSGAITSRCETGVDEDAGRWRLTFYHGGRALRLTVDGTGAILRRATFDVGRQPRPESSPSLGDQAKGRRQQAPRPTEPGSRAADDH
ncbi:hypothetical protein Rumeso_02443 [Rubellimicrobium mesophilum DSM 19309]|uniref:Uncharacterized protein n=1 Tax=Rubellimicrobium mesophilum DSM 19309 TaxID=442562 RepID=A0A017HQI2_9RHOB|nr:hypothetical protein Rumeso_02443 [Rubellimicrobium mesophilum DSM 19309]